MTLTAYYSSIQSKLNRVNRHIEEIVSTSRFDKIYAEFTLASPGNKWLHINMNTAFGTRNVDTEILYDNESFQNNNDTHDIAYKLIDELLGGH